MKQTIFFLCILFLISYMYMNSFIQYENIFNILENKNRKYISYYSSKLESEWLELLKENKNDCDKKYCKLVKPFRERLEKLQQDIAECKKAVNSKCEGDDLSYFMYTLENGEVIKEYIEPLFGILRNTFSVCNTGIKGDILSKNYLLPSYIFALQKPIVYIDAGASTFSEGSGGASQNFFYEFYKKYPSVKYKDWFLWESTIENMTKIYEEIPKDIIDKYHYYNKPIDTEMNSKDNPLNYIKKYQNNWYVIFKIDVDTPSVEIPIFNYLLEFDDIIPNEFYFEYHFYSPFMMRWWSDVDKNCSLYCATIKFLHLRKKGIRSHAWV